MIDLHSHILAGIDDGAQDLNMSIEMARVAVESGVKVMIATPHCADDRAREVYSAWKLLKSALQELHIPLRLGLGMEIFGSPDTVRLLQEGKLFTLNNTRYPLIEFRFFSDGEEETRILRDVINAGYCPVVAHPERYAYVQENPKLVNQWKKMGCLFQINRGSLLGRFGTPARITALELVSRGYATVVASDAHSPRFRTPWMEDVRDLLEQEFSPAAAEYLLYRNPHGILKDLNLPPVEPEWF